MCNKPWLVLAIFICLLPLPEVLAADIAKPTVDPAIYGHVSLIVWIAKDLDPVLDYYERLGLKGIERTPVSEFKGLTYRGKPAPTTGRFGHARIGDVAIEWIQPVTGTNIYTDFLKRHGDGVMALGYAVKSDEELERQIAYFHSKGVEALQRTQWKAAHGTGHGAYLDTAAKGGGISIALYHDPDGDSSSGTHTARPFDQITHFAFVVRDMKQVSDYWQALGFGALSIEHNVSVDRVFRGQPGRFEMDLGWAGKDGGRFEWIQSTQGPNVYEEYLQHHGEGFHHIGLEVPDMDAGMKQMAAKGAPSCQSGGWDSPGSKGRFAYLETDPHGGVTLELLWDQPMPNTRSALAPFVLPAFR